MATNTKILKLKDHTLNIDMLWIKNSEKDNTEKGTVSDVTSKVSEVVGDLYPVIDINNFRFSHHDIQYMEINERKFLPTIKITVSDLTGAFTNKFFPKNKSLMKVYIKSSSSNIKPIRNDYLIEDIKPIKSTEDNNSLASEGRGHSYVIYGTLNVPLLTSRAIDVYESSSYDALYTITDKTNLGFATNEEQTNDVMNWIQSCSYQEMIENLTSYSYKDSDSFFMTFVDRYYNLNFINLNNMLSQDEDFDAMFLALTKNKDSYLKNSENHEDDVSESLNNSLSNFSGFRGNSNYISSFVPLSIQGKILKNNPDRKYINYYDTQASDVHDEKFIEYFSEPHGSVRSDEEIAQNSIWVWENIDYNNTHDNFIFAKKSNIQHTLDLKKIKVKVTIESANFNLLRGMRIPLLMIKEGHQQMINETSQVEVEESTEKDAEDTLTFDSDNSGYYIIDNIKYIYNPLSVSTSTFQTEVELCRASWGTNIEEETNV